MQDYFSDNEEMLAKFAAGATGYDIIVPTGNAVETLIAQGVLRELDKSKMSGLENIKPEFRGLFFDPDNRYSIPYAYSITLIGYNKERIEALQLPTDTWALIFEPEHLAKIEGKVTVLDSQRELFAAALMYLGHSANETDEGKLKEARELILRAKPYWAAFNASSYIKELTIGNIWVAHGYSNDMFQAAADARKAGRPFSIASSTPREGAVLAVDNFVLHKTGPRPDLAYEFINFMLVGETAAQLSNMIGSGNRQCRRDAVHRRRRQEQQGGVSRRGRHEEAADAEGLRPPGAPRAEPHLDRGQGPLTGRCRGPRACAATARVRSSRP